MTPERAPGRGRAEIAAVLRRHTPDLISVPGVIGTGEGRSHGRPVIVVFVVRRTPEISQRLPAEIEGYVVEIRESGEVTAPPHP